MVYEVKITQKERLLDSLCISEQEAWINGVGFVKEGCKIVLMSNQKLEQRFIDYIVESRNICYKSHEEFCIDNQYCYFIYPIKKRRKK